MRITVTIDDELYNKALEMAGPEIDEYELFEVVFKTFVSVQAAKRLAALGGTKPDMSEIPRGRGETGG